MSAAIRIEHRDIDEPAVVCKPSAEVDGRVGSTLGGDKAVQHQRSEVYVQGQRGAMSTRTRSTVPMTPESQGSVSQVKERSSRHSSRARDSPQSSHANVDDGLFSRSRAGGPRAVEATTESMVGLSSNTSTLPPPIESERSDTPPADGPRGRARERAWEASTPLLAVESPMRATRVGIGTPPRSHVGPAATLVSDNRANIAAVTDATARGELMSREGTPSKVADGTKSVGFLSTVLNAAQTFGSTVLSNSTGRSPLSVMSTKTGYDHPASPTVANESVMRDDSVSLGLSLRDMGIGRDDIEAPAEANIGTQGAPSRSGITEDSSGTQSGQTTAPTAQLRSGSVAAESFRTRRRSSTGHSLSGLLESYGQTPKITGFAVASNKRNREFHALFRSVPDNDYLLDDYGCALQREILIQGRMYVSEAHLCFNSNIFGWVTNLVVAFADITAIEKRSTAGIFPNAIQISTSQAKHTFASFISRDSVFDLLVNIWKLGHPAVQTTAHGVETIPEMQYESSTSEHDTFSGSEHELSADSAGQEDDSLSVNSFAIADDQSVDEPLLPGTKTGGDGEGPSLPPGPAAGGVTEHAPTEAPTLTDGTMFKTEIVDEQIGLPLGVVYDLVFGEDSSFMRDFLEQNQKLLEVSIGHYTSSEAPHQSRKLSYIKPLAGPIGPKQTKCLLDDVVERVEKDEYMQVIETTTTPDVPSGDAFQIKTRYSFMWGQKNKTRLVIHCDVNWSKTSWIKGVIEKSAIQGQIDYGKSLVEALRSRSNGDNTTRSKRRRSRAPPRRSRSSQASHDRSSNLVQTDKQLRAPAGPFDFIAHINVSLLLFVMLGGMLINMWRMQQTIKTLMDNRPQGLHSFDRLSARWQDGELDLWSVLSQNGHRDMSGPSPVQGERRSVADSEGRMLQLQLSELVAQTDQKLALLREAQQLHEERLKIGVTKSSDL